MWTALSDEEVVARVVEGQTALFEVLMRRHNERIYRAARSIVRDEDEAEDVMQQAYVNAYAHLRQFDGRARFSTWLTKIAIHEALARVRKRGRTGSVDDTEGESEAVEHQTAPALDTAACLGVSEDVVKTRLSRGRAALRRRLAERAGMLAPETFRFAQPRCDRVVATVFARIS
jgi:RNA polymerase sigma-70 factor (ECF subfamily)